MLKDEAMISDAHCRIGVLSNFHVRIIFNDLMLRNICEILKKCFILIDNIIQYRKKNTNVNGSFPTFSFCYRLK